MIGFRGATAQVGIPLDVNKSVILIFGANGTGKSTIADAFDFICNKALGSLDTYSLGGTTKKHVASLNCKDKDVRVSLSCGSSAWTAILGPAGPVVSPSIGCPDARILRRKSILKLIEAQPKQRFEELKAFISVPGIDKSEKSLRDAVNAIQSSYNEAVRALAQANDELERLWNAEGTPGQDAITWAKQEAQKNIAELQSTVDAIDKLEDAFQDAQAELSQLDRALSQQESANELLTQAEMKQKEVEKQQMEKNTQLLKLLEEAKAYITQKGPLKQCPVCEEDIDSSSLSKRLTERINDMHELSGSAVAVINAKDTANTRKTITQQITNLFFEKAKKLAALLQASTLPIITNLKIKWDEFDNLILTDKPSKGFEEQGRLLLTLTNSCPQALNVCKDKNQKSINLHNAIRGHFETLNKKASDAKGLEKLAKKLKDALEIVSHQRKVYIEGILSSISTEVEMFYSRLHPGEGIGNIRFFLKPNTIGSLEIDGQFHDISEVPPQAYYSESHLDTLGICVFLALSNRFKSENTILILDDVLTSVDGPHLDRFMELLSELAANFNQLIVTTHYRPWRDRYRWAKGPSANTQIIELGPWTLKNGLQTGQFLTAVAELRQNLVQPMFDRQAVASKAGIVLESLLDFITLKFRCAIPRTSRNEYTLGDLALGIDSKLGKELRSRKIIQGSTTPETFLKPLIDMCTTKHWIRNSIGCHFNVAGCEVTDGEVREFGENVLTLTSNLICASCGMLPTRRPSGSYWECKCGSLQLYPLIYPGFDLAKVDDEF